MSDEEEVYPPWNYSWVVDKELAAMALPRNEANMRFLEREGIKHLITLSPEKLPPYTKSYKFDWTVIPCKEFEAPSVKDVVKFIDVCQRCYIKKLPVGVHCRMGRGRTGVMVACYLAHFQGLPPERAIINVRLQRPGSVETPEQERCVVRYHDCLMGTVVSDIKIVHKELEKRDCKI